MDKLLCGVKLYSTLELWQAAYNGIIETGSVFEDRHKNQFVYTGKSFCIYHIDRDNVKKVNSGDIFITMCVDDMFEFMGVDETEKALWEEGLDVCEQHIIQNATEL